MTPRWTIVIPVKGGANGKSRLTGSGLDRATLAEAMALDTIAAACATGHDVVVVTRDGGVAASALGIGARVCDEGDAHGLDAAVAAGVLTADPRAPRAALLGDLPALRPDDLRSALSLAAVHARAVVADAEGTGSTLVTASAGVAWASAFGDGSFARHAALGCVALTLPDASTLRRDVDTAAQLREAATLGVGPRTAALLPLGAGQETRR